MKLAMVGVGQAGGKIVDRFLQWDADTGGEVVRGAVAVNTARADLQGLARVAPENRVLVGQARVKGHGVGADNELGAEVVREDVAEVQEAIDRVPVHGVDAFLVVAGLGGGTGSGGAPVVARHLKRLYTEPVYGLGVLPAREEGGLYTLNAARSFRTLVGEVDNLLLFDNDAWRTAGESLREGYETRNEEVVRRLGLLFGAGEVSEGDAVAESVVDASEVVNTLAAGGVTTIGYAADPVERGRGGLLGRLNGDGRDGDEGDDAGRIVGLVRKAALGRLTSPCEVDSAERALLVVAGPPAYLDRRGVERGRRWLEAETGSMEVRGGDYPLPDERAVGCVVVLSGVSDVPRIRELQAVALEASDALAAVRERHDDDPARLVEEGADDLSPLF